MKLTLAIKFNIVFVLIFAIGLVAAGTVANRVLQQQAVAETRHDADVLLSAAGAMQNYTAQHVTPLLSKQIQSSFVPESVPAFSAIEMLQSLQSAFPDFSYRSTMVNPTNPRDRPSDWEAEVIAHLHDQPGLKEITGQRQTPGGDQVLFLARPTRITDSSCMQCHSTPSAAPHSVIDQYGPANGFNWPMNEVIGAEFVSVPASEPIARSHAVWRSFMIALTVVFALVLVVLNVMVHLLVTRRLQDLSRAADEVSLGKLDGAELATQGGDEIASLAVSFNRLRTSLVTAFEILEADQEAATVVSPLAP